jgi:hypothetical protein
MVLAVYCLGLLMDPEDGSNTFFRNLGKLIAGCMGSHHGIVVFDRTVVLSPGP